MIVLDTNVISEPNKPAPHPAFADWYARQSIVDLYLCAPIVMELFFGAERQRIRTGSHKLFLGYGNLVASKFRGRVLSLDVVAAEETGKIRALRESIGRPIGLGDAMIAAICVVNGATLATRNVRDFDGLDMKLVNPFETAG